MKWGFDKCLAFATVMTLRDMSDERETRLFKTQRYYQELYERIAKDYNKAFDIAAKTAYKASRRYIPKEISSGSMYLALYCFALVIKKQGRVTAEQNKILKIYFKNFRFYGVPFSQNEYINAVKNGYELGDFREVISISKSYAGKYWVSLFRVLYKSGTQEDLQKVVDCVNSMIMRFSLLGNPDSTLYEDICRNFVESVNYQASVAKEIGIKEIDWLGIVPISERLNEMKKFYEGLIDSSNVTETVSKEELLPCLELLVLNSICDIVMLTDKSMSIKIQMMNDAYNLSGIKTDVTPKEYLEHINNNTELGVYYKYMFSSTKPLGAIWQIFVIIGEQSGRNSEAIGIANNLLSILLQIENFLDEKYRLTGTENISQEYIYAILKQLVETM